jgi:hypothetical protein
MYQREAVLYTRSHSLNGWRAERFLRHIGCRFEVIDTRPQAARRALEGRPARGEPALRLRRPPYGRRHGHGEGAGWRWPVRSPVARRPVRLLLLFT